jgi:hypothetical protein
MQAYKEYSQALKATAMQQSRAVSTAAFSGMSATVVHAGRLHVR